MLWMEAELEMGASDDHCYYSVDRGSGDGEKWTSQGQSQPGLVTNIFGLENYYALGSVFVKFTWFISILRSNNVRTVKLTYCW